MRESMYLNTIRFLKIYYAGGEQNSPLIKRMIVTIISVVIYELNLDVKF